jgi:2,3-bisphosphoglycerate-dependent phosphoglycerate mutase
MTKMTERCLLLVRHGQSEGNLKNVFTGWTDLPLTDVGVSEARAVARRIARDGASVDVAFTSSLRRAWNTSSIILEALGQTNVETIRDHALDERNYGELTGLNKDQARKRWGEEQVRMWRRSYEVAPPGGESLKDTVARALLCYLGRILPRVMRGERAMVVAHGNSLRALVMGIEDLSPAAIMGVEIATGEALLYRLAPDTTVIAKERLGSS